MKLPIIVGALQAWGNIEEEPRRHDLEPEQIAALKFMDKERLYMSQKAIEIATNCDALALGDLMFKGLIEPIFGDWTLTGAGEREARR